MAKDNTLRGQTSVEVGGKSHDILLNMNAFRLLTQDRGLELSSLDEFVSKNPLEFVPTVVYWGIMNAADFGGFARPDIAFDHLAAVAVSGVDAAGTAGWERNGSRETFDAAARSGNAHRRWSC